MRLIALAISAAACADDTIGGNDPIEALWRDDQPVHAMTRADVPEASRQAFKRRVETDINRWRTSLLAIGCPAPFRFVNDDIDDPLNAVRLIPNEHWTDSSVGKWGSGAIVIRAEGDGTLDTYADDPTWTVGLHELGHALGLAHAEPIDGEPSIMTSSSSSAHDVDPDRPLPDRDVSDAACVLGCGPCA